jgi:hypothetical protein
MKVILIYNEKEKKMMLIAACSEYWSCSVAEAAVELLNTRLHYLAKIAASQSEEDHEESLKYDNCVNTT